MKLRNKIPSLILMCVVACDVDYYDPYAPNEYARLLTAVEPLASPTLTAFQNQAELDAFVAAYARPARGGMTAGCASSGRQASGLSAPSEDSAASDQPAASDESITNNQTQGVDEGGIVKTGGDFFIMLRRGRIFTVRHTADGQAVPPIAVDHIDAFAPHREGESTWFDELLVDGSNIVVIGYSYRVGATEVGLFSLSPEGKLAHVSTHFLASNDYYSSRNYASRLKDGKLIFYMPSQMLDYNRRYSPPTLQVTADSARTPLLQSTSIMRPVSAMAQPVLHTVVTCDLRAEIFGCDARAVIGSYSQVFYVSQSAVYVWTTSERADEQGEYQAIVYRLPLDHQEPITVASGVGAPIDQFSFIEREDGRLDVLLQAYGHGQWMFGAESQRSTSLALARIPLTAFTETLSPLTDGMYTPLPLPTTYSLQNRFIGDRLVYGSGSGWYSKEQVAQPLYVVNTDKPKEITTLQIDHDVQRIEALGQTAAFIAGTHRDAQSQSLVMQSIALTNTPTLVGRVEEADAYQGETRSHGFFFKADGSNTGAGVAALPVRKNGQAYQSLRYGSAGVDFLRVDAQLGFSKLGSLDASDAEQEDKCKVSCTDWYGNARPIFYKGRVFALLGYELVEGNIADAVAETARISFVP